MNQTETESIKISRFNSQVLSEDTDLVAVEEPLEISIAYFKGEIRVEKNISITMRTPGNDKQLAIGFLFTEGIVSKFEDLEKTIQKAEHSILIELKKGSVLDLSKIERHFYTSSSCGVCGKSSIESLRTLKTEHLIQSNYKVKAEVLLGLNMKVKQAQAVFESTGGLHASALFSISGKMLDVYEDIGRHNALDKLIGHAFMSQKIPLQEQVLFLSGRACYELIQKAAMAGITCICALGAPSSLAVELAIEFNITLVGFLKQNTFNIYSHPERITV